MASLVFVFIVLLVRVVQNKLTGTAKEPEPEAVSEELAPFRGDFRRRTTVWAPIRGDGEHADNPMIRLHRFYHDTAASSSASSTPDIQPEVITSFQPTYNHDKDNDAVQQLVQNILSDFASESLEESGRLSATSALKAHHQEKSRSATLGSSGHGGPDTNAHLPDSAVAGKDDSMMYMSFEDDVMSSDVPQARQAAWHTPKAARPELYGGSSPPVFEADMIHGDDSALDFHSPSADSRCAAPWAHRTMTQGTSGGQVVKQRIRRLASFVENREDLAAFRSFLDNENAVRVSPRSDTTGLPGAVTRSESYHEATSPSPHKLSHNKSVLSLGSPGSQSNDRPESRPPPGTAARAFASLKDLGFSGDANRLTQTTVTDSV